MEKPKFKVNEFVKVKYGENQERLHIVEVLTQQCYSGVQIKYVGRLYSVLDGKFVFTKEYYTFLEIELTK